MSYASPKLHNAMWPGLVGKGTDEGQEPPISLDRMLELTAAAEVDGQTTEVPVVLGCCFREVTYRRAESSLSLLVQVLTTLV